MCVLVVLAIHHDQLPKDRPLRRSDMSVMAFLPSPIRNKEQVATQLQGVADQFGKPMAVLSDGASELRAATETSGEAETLENVGILKKVVHLSDFKHKISNGLKKRLGGNESFKSVSARVAASDASTRQTELDNLQPPHRRGKCRFMNIHREIDWAKMVLDQLDAHADGCDQFAERMREKLGWSTEFRESIGHWQQCRTIISEALKMGNHEGVFCGATEQLRLRLAGCQADSALTKDLRDYIIGCYQENEAKLKQLPQRFQHMPCSTEVLESAFGSFKAIQRHHNRGTFTTLLAAFATLFERFTAEGIREQLGGISNSDLKKWLKDNGLLNSTQSRRAQAYARTHLMQRQSQILGC